ncbi:MAG: hypothetical protein E7311_05960 [Clostridiales bacterium]|nr:hypothetical protein [Clostridiales bacterium]
MRIYKFDDIKSKMNKKKIIIMVVILIVILFFTLYKFCYPFRQLVNNICSITPSINLNLTTLYVDNESINGIVGYDKYFSILSQNKLSTYTTKEKADFETNVKITNMISSQSGSYLAIAQKNATDLYLFNGDNLKYEINTTGNISQISVNKNGYVAVSVAKSGYRTIIVLYNPQGQEVFTTYLVNTYANDIKISDNNKYLAFSEIDTSGIQPVSKIKFIQIDKVGTDNYIIDTETEENTIISKLEFHNNNEVIYLTDGKIKKVNINGEKTDILDISNKNILNIDISLGNVIVIVEKNSNNLFKNSNDIKTYDLSGNLISSYQVDYTIKQLKVNDNIICANIGQTAYFITSSGRLINKYEAKADIKDVIIYDNGTMAALIYRNKIELMYI